LLEQGATREALESYLEEIVGNHMGLGKHGIEYVRSTAFAASLKSWFETRWPDSSV